ncbi:hypothetical protein B1R32_110100 [Abditibacterium utsteinense]|uniref:Uncharacterized protein n=1 Tax=Abditibacterium utsteinense TaxID=1960156 RepID=A0A2S8SS43_9BACT|nr:hypothetical protein B1R32_110100 [Abditibacterium utsteinense]
MQELLLCWFQGCLVVVEIKIHLKAPPMQFLLAKPMMLK